MKEHSGILWLWCHVLWGPVYWHLLYVKKIVLLRFIVAYIYDFLLNSIFLAFFFILYFFLSLGYFIVSSFPLFFKLIFIYIFSFILNLFFFIMPYSFLYSIRQLINPCFSWIAPAMKNRFQKDPAQMCNVIHNAQCNNYTTRVIL